MPQMGVLDQAELLEQLQGAVHRGDVDLRAGLSDLVRRRVAEVADRGQHLQALRRDPQAASAQPGRQLVLALAHRRPS